MDEPLRRTPPGAGTGLRAMLQQQWASGAESSATARAGNLLLVKAPAATDCFMANRATPFTLTNASDTRETFENISPACCEGMEESSLDHEGLIFHQRKNKNKKIQSRTGG